MPPLWQDLKEPDREMKENVPCNECGIMEGGFYSEHMYTYVSISFSHWTGEFRDDLL